MKIHHQPAITRGWIDTFAVCIALQSIQGVSQKDKCRREEENMHESEYGHNREI